MNAEIADTDFSSVPLAGEFVRELNTDTNSSSFPTATNISEEF